jgi:hypothetical protein
MELPTEFLGVILLILGCLVLYCMTLRTHCEELKKALQEAKEEITKNTSKLKVCQTLLSLIFKQTQEEHEVQVAQMLRVTEFLRTKLEENQLKQLTNEEAELIKSTTQSAAAPSSPYSLGLGSGKMFEHIC